MKKGAIIPLVVGLLIGVFAIKLGLDAIQKAKASSTVATTNVVVAADGIDATAQLDVTMVKLMETPVSPLLGNDYFTKLEDVVGRVLSAPLPRGAVVRENLLAAKGTPPGLVVRIPKGFRAVSVRIDEVTGVAFQLRPGAFVDVIAVMDLRKGGRRETVSRVVLQHVEVAAVGRTLSPPTNPDGKGTTAKSVTLLVKESEVPKFHLAQTRGKLTLALRSVDDDQPTEEHDATESELLGERHVQANPRPSFANVQPQTPHVVTVINGNKPPVSVTFADTHSLDRTNGIRRTRSSARPQPRPSEEPDAADNDDDDDDDEPTSPPPAQRIPG